ncbi:MAG: acetyltransferase [Lachnospiraceae bacterium]|nr:acetyltransferase [Lachnospiraceae bacterium]
MKLLLYGAGGLAKETYDIVVRSYPEKYEKIYFIDDFVEEAEFYLSESIHFDSIKDKFKSFDDLEGVVAVGEPVYREKLSKKFDEIGIRLTTIIDKTALVSPMARIKEGAIIREFTSIQPTADIGKSVLIQPYCSIAHGTIIGDYSVISSNCTPGGDNTIGKRVFMGMNSSTKEKIHIEDDSILGMGSIVFRDVKTRTVVVGNPARITLGNNEHKVFD